MDKIKYKMLKRRLESTSSCENLKQKHPFEYCLIHRKKSLFKIETNKQNVLRFFLEDCKMHNFVSKLCFSIIRVYIDLGF